MKLSEAERKKRYILEEIKLDEKVRKRLFELGMTRDCVIEVINSKPKGPMAVLVRGTRLAVGRSLCKGILVREIKNENL